VSQGFVRQRNVVLALFLALGGAAYAGRRRAVRVPGGVCRQRQQGRWSVSQSHPKTGVVGVDVGWSVKSSDVNANVTAVVVCARP
jgi:hypothetical protein